MAQDNRKTHKHTRTSPEWGEEYSYYERNRQMAKAHRLMEYKEENMNDTWRMDNSLRVWI